MKTSFIVIVIHVLLISCVPQSDTQTDEVFEDFETSISGSWKATGGAFENGPHREDEVFNRKEDGI